MFTKFGGKVAWAVEKPLDFGGNPDHVTLGLGLLRRHGSAYYHTSSNKNCELDLGRRGWLSSLLTSYLHSSSCSSMHRFVTAFSLLH